MQVTTGAHIEKRHGDNAAGMPLRVEYGITDAFEVELEWEAITGHFGGADDAVGPGDMAIGARYTAMNLGGSNLHAAGGFELELPTGNADADLGEGAIVYEPFVLLAVDLPTSVPVQLFTQVAVGFVQRIDGPHDETAAHELFWSSGAFVALGPFRVTTEITWNTNRWNGGDESALELTPGLVWHPSEAFEVGFGVPIGLTADADPIGAILLFTIEIEDVWRRVFA